MCGSVNVIRSCYQLTSPVSVVNFVNVERMFLVYVGIRETFHSFRTFPQPAGNGAGPHEAVFL